VARAEALGMGVAAKLKDPFYGQAAYLTLGSSASPPGTDPRF
jgi:hypothetical protein